MIGLIGDKMNNNFYNTCRLDIFNQGIAINSIELMDFSTDDYEVIYPDWLNNDLGKGVLLTSSANKMDFTIKCINDGVLNIVLRTLFFMDKTSKQIPIYIDYTKLVINDEVIFDSSNLVTHDENITYMRNVQDNELINIHIEWKELNYNSSMRKQAIIKDKNMDVQKPINIKTAQVKLENIGSPQSWIFVLNNPKELGYVGKTSHLADGSGSEVYIRSFKKKFDVELKFIEDGEFRLTLENIDGVADNLKVFYKDLVVDDSEFECSNQEECYYSQEVKNGQTVSLSVEWE